MLPIEFRRCVNEWSRLFTRNAKPVAWNLNSIINAKLRESNVSMNHKLDRTRLENSQFYTILHDGYLHTKIEIMQREY